MADPPGGASAPARIGRYRILERIGRGAMGAVYAALDEQLDRRVAVKVILADLDEEPEIRERFYREARVTGQLAHRNIVTLLDVGEDGGRPFLVMELLDGVPLPAHLATPAARTIEGRLTLMMQLCDALQNAHRCGVVHRDVKPNNLFVLGDGTLKVLDFGVARLAASSLTASGLMVGTPEYMSPEQARGEKVDARSDIFSAATVCYFMLAGASPFGSRDLRKTLHALMQEDPPPLSDDTPEALRRVVMKGLAKAPADRYQDCAAMLDELTRVRRHLEVAAHRVTTAALDRYRQTVSVIEERRTVGRSLGDDGIDAACDEAVARLAGRFPAVAAQVAASGAVEPLDDMAGRRVLEALQVRYSAEAAALAALQEEAADRLRAGAPGGGGDGRAEAADSLKTRAAALWRRVSGAGT